MDDKTYQAVLNLFHEHYSTLFMQLNPRVRAQFYDKLYEKL